jgi:hypothetical protein
MCTGIAVAAILDRQFAQSLIADPIATLATLPDWRKQG